MNPRFFWFPMGLAVTWDKNLAQTIRRTGLVISERHV